WIAGKKITLRRQMALHKGRDLPEVPLIVDLARDDRDRQILKLVLARQQMGWPFLAPPDLPTDRAQALRQAFDATMRDAEYLAEAKQRALDVNPMTGAEIDQLVGDLYRTSPDVIAATKSVTAEGARKASPPVPSAIPLLRLATVSPRVADRAPHPLWRHRDVEVTHAQHRERVDHRVGDRRQRTDTAGLAAAFDAERVGLGRHRVALHRHRGQIAGARHSIVHERAGHDLAAVGIEPDVLHQHLSGALRHAPDDLAVHEQRVDHGADVVDHAVADDFDHAGLLVDLHFAHVAAVGIVLDREAVDRG